MKLKCGKCEQVTEHVFTGVFSDGQQLLECKTCHQRVWVRVEEGSR